MPPGSIDELFQHTQKKLVIATRRFFSLKGFSSTLFFLFSFLSLFLVFILLELLFDLAPFFRLSFWVLVFLVALFFSIRYFLPLIKPVFHPQIDDFYKISRIIGSANSDVQDSLIDFLQIYNEQSTNSYPVFKYLSLKQLYIKFQNVDFHNIVNFRILIEPAKRLSIVGIVFLLLFLLFPQSMTEAALRVLNPTKSFEKPLPITLNNKSGDKVILKNEKVSLEGDFEGTRPQKLWLMIETSNTSDNSKVIEKLEVPLNLGKNFFYEIMHVKYGFFYWFEAEIGIVPFKDKTVLSNKGEVIVKERPYIRNLQIKLNYPAYTKLPDQLLAPNDGEISALIGTGVNIEIEANKILANADIVFLDSSTIPLKIIENRGYGKFVINRDEEYKIVILDNDSITNYQPVQYSIFALQDENPFVEIAKPGQDLDLEDDLKISILVNLRDDFGFTKLKLKGNVIRAASNQDTNTFDIELPYQNLERGKAISETQWDLYPFYLTPEDYITYYAEVFDNDRVSGPKSARSNTFIIRLPSIMDMIEQSGEELAERLDQTDEIVKKSGELRKKLEEVNRDMKRENELTWERKKELKEHLENQKESLEKLESIQKNLEEIVNELDNREMLSAETLEKYFELQKMFHDLATPEIQDAMNKLQEALEKSDLDEVKKALQEFSLSVDEFEKSIERTYELFKQIQLEQKMDEINKLAEKITEDQKQINKSLKEDQQVDKNQLGNKENNLERETNFLQEKMEETQKEFQEKLSNQLEDLRNAQEFLKDNQISDQMREMQQQLYSGDIQQAQKSGQNIQQQMEMLQSMLQQAKQNMAQMQKQEVMQAMQKVTQDILKASYQQEGLFEQSNRTDIASSQVNDIARKQGQMRENAIQIIKQLVDISKKTFFLSPQLNQTMASLMSNMDNSLGNLENRDIRNAANAQKKAMANLNQAILSMQNSMDQLSHSSSASGFEQFMQQLQQMAGQQGQLNQQSMSLMNQLGEGKLQLSNEALARLAAQQDMIRQSLEKLNDEMGHQGNVLGRLDDLGKEMEDVVKKLQQQQFDRKVIERQEKILSRLLDAQKSVREKEYSKKREAEREDRIIVKSPPELRREIMDRENKLQKELIQSLKEGYSTEYKDYIKLYYEILSRRSVEDSNF